MPSTLYIIMVSDCMFRVSAGGASSAATDHVTVWLAETLFHSLVSGHVLLGITANLADATQVVPWPAWAPLLSLVRVEKTSFLFQ